MPLCAKYMNNAPNMNPTRSPFIKSAGLVMNAFLFMNILSPFFNNFY